ncbi:sporulation membrane protein YtaF [Clostridium sp.]|uniref:sporulation membrane protein YtaF n=1 Tax=Clostridium sp. TaxID=1506 RepID=UPI0026DD3954|nr:sporulation membrane protein YtaF [Clostridium sp.]MDO5038670.1 sporulation membrane protein YtaF [Clostridium sp.]
MEILILVFSLVIDSFVASIAYGADKIKIPNLSVIIINVVSCAMLAISLLLGNYLENIMPKFLPKYISFFIFVCLGIYKLFEVFFKKYISNFSKLDKPLTFKLFDFKFALTVYIDETKADFDKSKKISIKESIYLALALSIDSLAVGFGASFLSISPLLLLIACFLLGILAIKLGCYIGSNVLKKQTNTDLSWLSGICLLLIAFLKL